MDGRSPRERIVKHSGRFVSPHGLENHGVTKAQLVHWNDCAAPLYQMAVERREGLMAEGGPLVVADGDSYRAIGAG